jgi:hypothetical protein
MQPNASNVSAEEKQSDDYVGDGGEDLDDVEDEEDDDEDTDDDPEEEDGRADGSSNETMDREQTVDLTKDEAGDREKAKKRKRTTYHDPRPTKKRQFRSRVLEALPEKKKNRPWNVLR